MIIVGITGKSGSGKSMFSSFIRENNFEVIDCDEVARIIRKKEEVILKIKKSFPDCFLKNELSMSKLREKVFNSEKEFSKLNKIMFPLIIKEVKNIIKQKKKDKLNILFLDMAVLFQSKANKLVNKIILVDADRQTRLVRLLNGRKIEQAIASKQVDMVKITKQDEENIHLFIYNNSNEAKVLMSVKLYLLSWINSTIKKEENKIGQNKADRTSRKVIHTSGKKRKT